MRVARERLIFHAICVLDEAVERARRGAIKPYPALRLALAILNLHGAKRETIDRLWKALITEPADDTGSTLFGRRQTMTAAVNGICRDAGMERTSALEEASRRARGC